eukprot:1023386_1
MFGFGSKKTLKQVIRENKRIVNRSIREIDREQNRLKREKKRAEAEMKRLGKEGQIQAVKHLCKDVVRMNQSQQHMAKLKATLRQLSSQFNSAPSINDPSIQKTLKELGKLCQSVSNVIKLPELQAMLIKYTGETHHMEMKCDMICDAMDDVSSVCDDSDEADELYSRVLDEIGLDLGSSMVMSAPKVACMSMEEECDSGLQQRLAALSGSSHYSPCMGRFSVQSSASNVPTTIGLSVGGAKDVNNFRECIEKNRMPSSKSITYNGLLYEYYFDTKTRKHVIKSTDDEKKQIDKVDDGSNLFYPSYCYAKTRRLDFNLPSHKDNAMGSNQDEYEYYMTVGLNSNIKTNEFKRKHLNLVIVLDKSGSMCTRWDGKTKMQVANESVVALLSHLTPKDRFALITFNTQAEIMHRLQFIKDVNLDSLKANILAIRDNGGTNFESGYSAAMQIYQGLFNALKNDKQERAEWKADSKCEIYSESEKQWFDGTIVKVTSDKEGEWLTVAYRTGCDHKTPTMKQIQRFAKEIKPSARDEYENRVIFLTDARPNSGRTDQNSLLGMVQKCAENEASNEVKLQSDYDADEYIRNRIYTTFIGIGVDFNANLIESISKTRGCNYYSVKSTEAFMDKMDDEFEFMVTPLVFNVSLKINCEGNSCKIEKVYGSNQATAAEILKTGEISRIDTLFPAKRRAPRKGGGTKGGIQLIKFAKLKRDNEEDERNINVELVVTFEDRNGKKYKNEQMVTFTSPKLNKKDMIESDEEDGDANDYSFYDNTGIRKGILLCKYVELIKDWIGGTPSGRLNVNQAYKDAFGKCMRHFEKEMIKCKDNDLKKEIDLMNELVNIDDDAINQSALINTTNDNDEDALSDMQRRLAMLQ